jgi:5-methylthioadenosine/S-adenosylhomocysteine deaminase
MTQRIQETWILNGLFVTQDTERTVFKGHLCIRNGRIAALTQQANPSKGARLIDAKGLVILPGFIQTHIHLCQTLFRNLADDMELMDWLATRIWPFEASHTHATLYLSALLGIHELLAGGTTTLLDMGTMRHTDAIFQAVERSGIRANVGKCLMDHPETCPPYLVESTEAALTEAQALFHKWHGQANDRIRVSYAPRFVVSCTEPLLREVGRLSAEQGALIHTHSSENRKEVELVKSLTGQDNLDYLHHIGLTSERLVLAHCVWLSDQEIEAVHSSGTHVTHCPCSNMKLASGFAQIPKMLDKGINVALGADGAPCNNNLSIFQEMRLAGLIHKPTHGPRTMPATTVLDMATRNGAKALGWEDDIGSLEVGKKADIIALDLHQVSNMLPAQTAQPSYEQLASAIVYATQAAQVRWTLVDGEMVARDGKALKIPAKAVSAAAVHRAQREIFARVQKLEQA